MASKYQIFVSSTYEDLKEEREKAIQAIHEMGHIPVGMEMFSAADDTQWKLIQKQIDDCDYYVVIIGHKYGSMDGAVSYTEKEYDYAVSKNIPVLGFIIKGDAQTTAAKMENDSDKKKLLDEFKDKVKNKLVNFWQNKDELKGQISISLSKAFVASPRTGWIKANEAITSEIANQLTRLSKENAELTSN